VKSFCWDQTIKAVFGSYPLAPPKSSFGWPNRMPDSKETPPQAQSFASRLKRWLVPAIILLLAVGIVVLITTNWNTWAGGRAVQETDDAYLHADLTPLSTKVAGLVATVAVSDYQAVKAGDLLVALRDDDFMAQVQQAEAAVAAAEAAVVDNQKQKQLQDERIVEAEDGVRTATRISRRPRPASKRQTRPSQERAGGSTPFKRVLHEPRRSANARKH